jgi:dTDP-4-dehydrorhamnose 3,5-epimerase
MSQKLPQGLDIRELKPIADARGTLVELFRSDWNINPSQQWNLVATAANTLRGVHVHADHDDYLVVLDGLMHLGLHDLRSNSPTSGFSTIVELSGDRLQAAFIPRGVMHGFHCPKDTRFLFGLSECWVPSDDFACRWDDPELGIAWSAREPMISKRDADAPSLHELRKRLVAQQITF